DTRRLPTYIAHYHPPTHHRYSPSFPTRRSSDLRVTRASGPMHRIRFFGTDSDESRASLAIGRSSAIRLLPRYKADRFVRPASGRSEEHTSELQSRSELVCRLLLEKKNRMLLYVH